MTLGRADAARSARSGLSRRTFLRGVAATGAVAAATPLLDACGSDSGSGSGKATVTFWTYHPEETKFWPQVISDFEAAHPNISIKQRIFADPGQYISAIQPAVASGDYPDVFPPSLFVLNFGKQGVTRDLNAALGKPFTDQFFPSANAAYIDGDKQYGVGWQAQTYGMFYNPELLARAGVQYPETWDDLLNIAKPLQAIGVTPCVLPGNPGTYANDFFLPLVTQAADDPNAMRKMDLQQDGATWNSQPVIDALGMFKKLIDGGVFQPGITSTTIQQAYAQFYTGKAALFFCGNFGQAALQQSAPEAFKSAYKIGQTPAWKSGAKHWCGNQAGNNLALSANSKNPDAAVEWFKYIFESGRYIAFTNNIQGIPSLKSLADQVTDPITKEMASWLIQGNGCPHTCYGTGASDAVANQLSALVKGGVTASAAAASIQTDAQRALGR
ncbi:ABC transporter substrate-binding protein [Dactylosporangium sp. CA-092794]|uniref:ABC transporter substrate-binding protein n=1 Tax=Dactylosporangium sp. CA-092794 TaxID=3239929 RepID=UPI003D8CB7C0